VERTLLNTTRLVLALILVTPLIVTDEPLPVTYFPFIVGKALYARTLIEIGFGVWLVLVMRNSSYGIPRTWLLPIFGIYVAVTLASAFAGVSFDRSMWSTYERMQGWVDLLHWFVFVVVLVSTHRTWDHWRTLLNFNLGVSFVLGLMGLAQYVDQGIFIYMQATTRLDITLGNPAYAGCYMVVNLLIATGFLIQSFANNTLTVSAGDSERDAGTKRSERRRGARIPLKGKSFDNLAALRTFWIMVIALDFIIFYLSGTRGAMAGLLMGILAFAIAYIIWGKYRVIRQWSLGVILLILVSAVLVGISVIVRDGSTTGGVEESGNLLTRSINTGLGDPSLEGRLNAMRVGVDGFTARPILGWGPENYSTAYDQKVTPEGVARGQKSYDQAHNKLLEELTTKGVLGLLGYLAIWSYVVFIVFRKVKLIGSNEQIFVLFMVAAITAFFGNNLFLFDTPGTLPQFYVLLAFIGFVDLQVQIRRSTLPYSSHGQPMHQFLETRFGVLMSTAVVMVLVVAVIFVVNIRIFRAAQNVIGMVNPVNSWTERSEKFISAVTEFPQLGNYPRVLWMDRATRDWLEMDIQDKSAVFESINNYAEAGIEREPQEWRIRKGLAYFYQKAAQNAGDDREILVKKARQLVDEAVDNAPSRIQIQLVRVNQHLLESDPEGALEVIDSYLAQAPEAEGRMRNVRAQIVDRIEKRSEEE